MLPEDGPIVAPPDVPAWAWASALPEHASPLVLAPGSAGGWFGGSAIVCWSPRLMSEGLTIEAATAQLERLFSGEDCPALAVALLPYDGRAAVARYTGGLIRTDPGWRVWGDVDPGDVPPMPPATFSAAFVGSALANGVTTDLGEDGFSARVDTLAERMRAGDVYVVNLTRRITGTPSVGPPAAFERLVVRTRADMAAYWSPPGGTVASASPERFLAVKGKRVEIWPIKGTRPRAEGAADDEMRAELAHSPKERAEHVMVVDMERNDLGRVCATGSITVDPLFRVDTTPYCHQMVSGVRGVLRDDAGLAALIPSTFPCGSITGAPKIAAMRIIAELEATPRGAYTGALVVAVPGELDSSILIRTADYRDGVVRWGTGGGITVDSVPSEEWLESVLKATPFLGDDADALG